jgi:hypothetical protein
MGARLAGADDPEDIISLDLNLHHEEEPCPRGRAEDQQPVRVVQTVHDRWRTFIVVTSALRAAT